MEIEAKFVLPDRDAMVRLQRVVRLGPFVPGEPTEHETIDIYLDTKDRTLYRNGYACRLRLRGEERLVTIKGLGGVEAAIHSRFESEQALSAEATEDPETWPEGEGRALVLGLSGQAPLLELFVVEQVRWVRLLSLEERLVAELSLDQAEIRAGDRQARYLCLEAELAGEGEIDDLRVLTEHLTGTWGLVPEPRSKFEHGWALLEQEVVTEEASTEATRPPKRDGLVREISASQESDHETTRSPSRLTETERTQLERLVQEAPDQRERRYAALVLGWADHRSVRKVGQETGFSQSWAYELIARFQKERMALFSVPPVEEMAAPVAQAAEHDGLPEVQRALSVGRTGESELEGDAISVEMLCERFQVDKAHARYVTEVALLLFDQTEPIHYLDAERRGLLATMAMLHNVGLEVDPDRHHVRGREIVLEHRLLGLTEIEQRMLAAAVYLHRKRIRRRKLEAGIVASLPLGVRHDTCVLSALVRMADGLDYSQNQSTSVEGVHISTAAVQVVVSGPSAEVDAARAQAKADLWEMLYGDTPFFFAVQGLKQMDPQVSAVPVTEGAPTAQDGTILAKGRAPKSSPGILPDDSMGEAGRKVLAFHFARMLEHEPGTRVGTDIEELHDMRVATRRMRSALRVFAPYYKARTIRPYVVGLRRTARALGPVRDLDVFMQKADGYLSGLGPERASDLDLLLDVWRDQRKEARTAMLHVLDSSKYRDFVNAFGLFLETFGAGAQQNAKIPPRPTLVRHVAPQLIYGRWASVQAFAPLLEGAPVSVLHALRIECKRLRYTLEFFSEVLAPQARKVIEAVVRLQDHLGDLNDADVANAMLSDFLFAPRPGGEGERLIAPGVVAYLAVKQRELQGLVETFPQAWQAFNQPDLRQALAGAVAIL